MDSVQTVLELLSHGRSVDREALLVEATTVLECFREDDEVRHEVRRRIARQRDFDVHAQELLTMLCIVPRVGRYERWAKELLERIVRVQGPIEASAQAILVHSLTPEWYRRSKAFRSGEKHFVDPLHVDTIGELERLLVSPVEWTRKLALDVLVTHGQDSAEIRAAVSREYSELNPEHSLSYLEHIAVALGPLPPEVQVAVCRWLGRPTVFCKGTRRWDSVWRVLVANGPVCPRAQDLLAEFLDDPKIGDRVAFRLARHHPDHPALPRPDVGELLRRLDERPGPRRREAARALIDDEAHGDRSEQALIEMLDPPEPGNGMDAARVLVDGGRISKPLKDALFRVASEASRDAEWAARTLKDLSRVYYDDLVSTLHGWLLSKRKWRSRPASLLMVLGEHVGAVEEAMVRALEVGEGGLDWPRVVGADHELSPDSSVGSWCWLQIPATEIRSMVPVRCSLVRPPR